MGNSGQKQSKGLSRRSSGTDLLYLGFVTIAALRSVTLLWNLGVHHGSDEMTARAATRNLSFKYVATPPPMTVHQFSSSTSSAPPAPVLSIYSNPMETPTNHSESSADDMASSLVTASHTSRPVSKQSTSQPTTSRNPTNHPTNIPTNPSTSSPTNLRTSSPTNPPTSSPTDSPTSSPTSLPTSSPTSLPTSSPTNYPTSSPTNLPTSSPTKYSTSSPTKFSTSRPTNHPTNSPTRVSSVAPVISVPSQSPERSSSTPQQRPLVEFSDCRTLAPCHVAGDDSNLTCAVFYAKRFWEMAPSALKDDLRYHRDHRPVNCWYETEMLWLHKLDNATTTPYPRGVCVGPVPEHLVQYHMFKVGGTTSRNALGLFGFPNYESRHVFSNELKRLFPDRIPLPGNFSDYLQYVDELKRVAYEKQVANSRSNLGFTFVRSPVQRFFSGLEQIQRLNNNEWEVSPEAQPCFELKDSLAKVECVVGAIQKTQVFFNVHLYPQAYLFDVWTKRGTYDLAIHVIDLKDMDTLFKRFKGKIVRRVRVSTSNNTKLHLVDRDLEPRLLQKICQLYQADLLMLQVLQMEDPICTEALNRSLPR